MTDYDSNVIENNHEYKALLHGYVALLHQWGYVQQSDVDMLNFDSVKRENKFCMELLEECHRLLIMFAKRRDVFLISKNSNPMHSSSTGICSPIKTPEIRSFDDLVHFVFDKASQASTAWPTPTLTRAALEELSIRRLRRDLYEKKVYFDETIERIELLNTTGAPD